MRRHVLFAALLALGCPAEREAEDPVYACLHANTGVPERFAPVVRAFCAEVTGHDVPGAAIAIVERGTPVLSIAHGRRCVGADDPVLSGTPFRIGSVTKAFTAAHAVALAEAGGVELDAPVSSLGGAFASAPERITLRALLDHRAGIAERMPTAANATLRDDALVRELLGAFDPSLEGPRYSSAGHALAAAALERASGEQWLASLRKRTTDPLGLTVATDEDSGIAGTAACGHLREAGSWHAYDVVDDFARFAHGARWAAPAGGLVTSAPDLARFGHALAADGALARMRSLLEAAPDGYALGLRKRTLEGGESLWHHGGDTGDFVAELAVLPRHDYAVAVVANAPASLRASVLAALAVAGVQARFDPEGP